ncbi:MAG: hypothetical protein ACKVOR_13490, partial [Flavobacteriales bacterium]
MKRLETAKEFVIYEEQTGILHFQVKPGTSHSLMDTKKKFVLARKLAPQGKMPVLVDGRGALKVDGQVRVFYGTKEAASIIKSLAIVVDTLSHRLQASFFIHFTRPGYRTR